MSAYQRVPLLSAEPSARTLDSMLQNALDYPTVLRNIADFGRISKIDAAGTTFCSSSGLLIKGSEEVQLAAVPAKMSDNFLLVDDVLYKLTGADLVLIAKDVADFALSGQRNLVVYWNYSLVLRDTRSTREVCIECQYISSCCMQGDSFYCAANTQTLLRLDLNRPQLGMQAVGALLHAVVVGLYATTDFVAAYLANSCDLYRLAPFRHFKSFPGVRYAQLVEIGGDAFLLDYLHGRAWRLHDLRAFSIPMSSIFDGLQFVFGDALCSII